jgi:hypothetical protein
MVAGDAAERIIHVVEPGFDDMSIDSDLFLIQRDPDTQLYKFPINNYVPDVDPGDLSVDDSVATLAWVLSDVVLVQRFDYHVANGEWIDVQPYEAETNKLAYNGSEPVMSRNAEGVVAVAWRRCNATNGTPCSMVVRRFQAGWIDPEPVTVTSTEGFHLYPQVAIADDGRVAMVWCEVIMGGSIIWARMLDADLALDGDAWDLQTGQLGFAYSDVAALSDGSFVFGWADMDRVHVRRFIGPNQPKVPELGDEAPWPTTDSPTGVSISSVDNHVVVVWSGMVDTVAQIQGQVLKF